MQRERYRRGSRTVTNLDYFLCKTKYSSGVLQDDAALMPGEIIREIGAEKTLQAVKGNILPAFSRQSLNSFFED